MTGGEMMKFPKTVDEFMESYKIVDTEQVYTNGSELVPIFRMRQWFEHLNETNRRKEAARMAERKYVAISIKHTEHRWKFGMPMVLWGRNRTEDNEDRCFSGYTNYFNDAELYALGDFKKHGYCLGDIKDDEAVRLCIGFCKKYKEYDTVLVEAEQYEAYCKAACLPVHREKE